MHFIGSWDYKLHNNYNDVWKISHGKLLHDYVAYTETERQQAYTSSMDIL